MDLAHLRRKSAIHYRVNHKAVNCWVIFYEIVNHYFMQMRFQYARLQLQNAGDII